MLWIIILSIVFKFVNSADDEDQKKDKLSDSNSPWFSGILGQKLFNNIIVKIFDSLRIDLQTGSNKKQASLGRLQKRGTGHDS